MAGLKAEFVDFAHLWVIVWPDGAQVEVIGHCCWSFRSCVEFTEKSSSLNRLVRLAAMREVHFAFISRPVYTRFYAPGFTSVSFCAPLPARSRVAALPFLRASVCCLYA